MKRASPAQKKLVANAINRVKLRHLTVLLEVARCGSARAAARTLCVTESAVSKTLKELETELDLRLFERSKSGMSITEAGLRFANYAESAVQALRIGMSSAHDALGVGAVAFSIGAMPIVATSILPAATQRLMDETPGLCLEVISGSKGVLLAKLREGSIEFALGRLPPPEDMTGLSFEQLLVDRYIFVVRAGHPLLHAKRLDLRALLPYPLLMPSRDTVTWSEIQRFFVAQGAALSPTRVETISLGLSRSLTVGSEAVWACSARLAQGDLQDRSLVQLPIDTSLLEAPLGVISKPGRQMSPTCRRLLQLVSEAI